MPAADTTDYALEVRRTFHAPRERVFAAWTKADAIRQWFAPGEMTVPQASVDLRIGGAYRIVMQSPDGKQHTATGTYTIIDPPARLAFTWSWEERAAVTDTLVTIDFIARGDSTEVVLRHELLPTEDERTNHERGWIGCLANLPKAL